jgi:hypothetical protein
MLLLKTITTSSSNTGKDSIVQPGQKTKFTPG